jgi:hypothetical protein
MNNINDFIVQKLLEFIDKIDKFEDIRKFEYKTSISYDILYYIKLIYEKRIDIYNDLYDKLFNLDNKFYQEIQQLIHSNKDNLSICYDSSDDNEKKNLSKNNEEKEENGKKNSSKDHKQDDIDNKRIKIYHKNFPNKRYQCDNDKNIEAIIEFYRKFDRLPKYYEILKTDKYEFTGYYFFGLKYDKIKLTEEQKRKLTENIPNWKCKKICHRNLQDKKIEAIIEFYKQFNRTPKINEELFLENCKFTGRYLAKLRSITFTMTREQQRKLDENIPHWREKI